LKKLLILPALLAASALVLAGCASSPSQADSDSGQLKVVATTTQIADFTREIAGSAATVTQLIQPNQSAHTYDPSAADLKALGEADVLVINGVGLEEWLDSAIEASGFHGVTIDSSSNLDLSNAAAGEPENHSDSADAAHSDSDHSDHDHSEQGGLNPHIWTDPNNARTMVTTISDGLAKADQQAAASFATNAEAYDSKLAALVDWMTSNVDAVPVADRLLVSNHDAFSYFVNAFDITYVGSVMPSFDDNAEPSAADIDALVAAIKKTGVKAVFSEASINPKTAATIATEAGVTVFSGDDALYGDSLGPAGSEGASYIASQIHNMTVILQSWGVTATAIPAQLQGA
jgi:ABC-type Zn uptake system ZnuABC Zn-binding protein ZnuA